MTLSAIYVVKRIRPSDDYLPSSVNFQTSMSVRMVRPLAVGIVQSVSIHQVIMNVSAIQVSQDKARAMIVTVCQLTFQRH